MRWLSLLIFISSLASQSPKKTVFNNKIDKASSDTLDTENNEKVTGDEIGEKLAQIRKYQKNKGVLQLLAQKLYLGTQVSWPFGSLLGAIQPSASINTLYNLKFPFNFHVPIEPRFGPIINYAFYKSKEKHSYSKFQLLDLGGYIELGWSIKEYYPFIAVSTGVSLTKLDRTFLPVIGEKELKVKKSGNMFFWQAHLGLSYELLPQILLQTDFFYKMTHEKNSGSFMGVGFGIVYKII